LRKLIENKETQFKSSDIIERIKKISDVKVEKR
jgi:hypothetical protein